jgi:hypothetical protein
MIAWLRSRWARVRAAIDIRDVHIYGGLAIASAGGWMLHRALTLIGVGLALTLMGLLAGRKAH